MVHSLVYTVCYTYHPLCLSHILDRWFESEPLKAVLATDSIIGAMLSPYMPGSGSAIIIIIIDVTDILIQSVACHVSHMTCNTPNQDI